MSTYDPTRYRSITFQPEYILDASELNELQVIGNNANSNALSAIYKQGALLNAVCSISGYTVTYTSADGVNPMRVFVRDRFENIKTVTTDIGPEFPPISLNLSLSQTNIYLNWVIVSVPNTLDTSLVSPAGELQLSFSAIDTSSASIVGTQIAKNTSPIIVATFAANGSTLVSVPVDNVIPQALASNTTSGLVSLSTYETNGVAVANSDPRNSDARVPLPLSVTNSTVYAPTASSDSNTDGTTVYTDTQGVSATKILLQVATQCLEDGWNWLKNQFLILQAAYGAHQGATLGPTNVHPIPTPSMVGAAPLQHVGTQLGLGTDAGIYQSHQPLVTASTGGFQLARGTAGAGAPDDPAFGVQNTTENLVSLNHDGDVWSSLANVNVATAANGTEALTVVTLPSQSLGHMSSVASVLATHVNQISHCNPHGLVAHDIDAPNIEQIPSLVEPMFPWLQSANGYINIPTSTPGVNLLVQWGTVTITPPVEFNINGSVSFSAPNIPFPMARVYTGIQLVNPYPTGVGFGDHTNEATGALAPDASPAAALSGFNYAFSCNGGESGFGAWPLTFFWLAIGY